MKKNTFSYFPGELMDRNTFLRNRNVSMRFNGIGIPQINQTEDNVDELVRKYSARQHVPNEFHDNNLDYLSWDFDVFAIKLSNPQSSAAIKVLSAEVTGIIESLKIPKATLYNYLLFVEENYSMSNYEGCNNYGEFFNNHRTDDWKNEEKVKKQNSYHNNLHGLDTFQAVLYFALTYNEVGGDFSVLGISSSSSLSLYISLSLCIYLSLSFSLCILYSLHLHSSSLSLSFSMYRIV